MLRVIERTFASAEDNLAFDDELLESRKGALRFWESSEHFVVLGRSGDADREVKLDACRSTCIPVVRRSTGGGAVVQGPGCLNYSLVLPLENAPELWNVERSYGILLGKVGLGLRVPDVEVCGSDILLGGRKISGNAQRRTKGWLLHHGTLLYGLEAATVDRLLLEPPRQPPHRNGRSHADFLGRLPLAKSVIIERIASAFRS